MHDSLIERLFSLFTSSDRAEAIAGGLRLMRKSWGLTLVGGAAMALTIGLGTAIFTLWNTATATTVPLPEGDRIVAIQPFDAAAQQIHRDSSFADFARWRELLRSVTDVSAMRLLEGTSSLRVAHPVPSQLPR